MSAHEPFDGRESWMESFWLPPGTVGNGCEARRWALLVVVPRERAAHLLGVFARHGIPARMAADPHPLAADTRVWVDPDRHAEAENLLLSGTS